MIMGDTTDRADGVFVVSADGPERTATGSVLVAARPGSMATVSGTDLEVRPGDHLAPLSAPGPLAAYRPPVRPPTEETRLAHGATGSRRTATAVIAAALVAAVAFGAAAFGAAGGGSPASTPTPASPGHALAAAAAQSTAATSVAFTVRAARTGTSGSTTDLLTGSGSVDVAKGIGSMTATIPALAPYVGSGQDGAQIVADGSAVYVDLPALDSLTGGTGWLKVTLPKDASAGADQASLAVLADPARLVSLLTSIGGTVTNLGTVDLAGAQTTEYRTTVTLADLIARTGLPTGGSATTSAIATVLSQLGSTSVPITAWVGKDGYVRQLQASLDLSRATVAGLAADVLAGGATSGSAAQTTSSTSVTVGFSHYGAPVSVQVPPASEVTDLGGVARSIGGAVSRFGHNLSGLVSSL